MTIVLVHLGDDTGHAVLHSDLQHDSIMSHVCWQSVAIIVISDVQRACWCGRSRLPQVWSELHGVIAAHVHSLCRFY